MKTTMLRTSFLRLAVLGLCTGATGAAALHAQDAPPPPPQGQSDQGGPGRGGPRGGGPQMQQQRLDRMTRDLALTPDQVTSVKSIMDDTAKQQMALRDDTSTAGPDRRTKMNAMREAENTKIKAVLTDDQKVKYDAMMAKMRERRQDGSGPPPPPPPQSN